VANTVAIAPDQFNGGKSCGRCIRLYSSGVKKPPRSLFATVDNLCPECRSGDIDLGLEGDGIWRVNWEFVPCHWRLRG